MLAEERGSEQTTKRTSKVRTICNNVENSGTDAFYLYTLVYHEPLSFHIAAVGVFVGENIPKLCP